MAKPLLSLLELDEPDDPVGRARQRLRVDVEKLRTVDPLWRLRLALRNRRWRRSAGSGPPARAGFRVGFGPVIEREDTLGFRKWGIDPVVDAINRTRPDLAADIFFGDEDLSGFDALVIVKNFETLSPDRVGALAVSGTTLVYNTRDNPAGCRLDFRNHPEFVDAMEGFVLSSLAQVAWFEERGLEHTVIGTPVINSRFKRYYGDHGTVRLVWQGYRTNAPYMERLHPIIAGINREPGPRLELLYHCDRRPERADDPGVRFRQWRISNWERTLAGADIGVVIKPAADPEQQEKPPTKVVSYMAAGLPVICTPSEADRRVIEHGRTGFFAESNAEWRDLLVRLGADPGLRERVGRAAREHALQTFAADRIAAQYIAFLEGLHAGGSRVARAGRTGHR